MSKNSPARRPSYMPSAIPSSGRSSLSRSQTPSEAMDSLYVGLSRTHAERGISSYAIESLGVVAARRRDVVEEFPEVAQLADMLITNMVRIMGGIQNSVIDDHLDTIV